MDFHLFLTLNELVWQELALSNSIILDSGGVFNGIMINDFTDFVLLNHGIG